MRWPFTRLGSWVLLVVASIVLAILEIIFF